MSRDNHTEVAEKLALLASTGEELHALLLDEEPAQAVFYAKIAATARAHATCWRLHKVLPQRKPGPPLVEAAKAATQIQRGIASVTSLFPKDKRR